MTPCFGSRMLTDDQDQRQPVTNRQRLPYPTKGVRGGYSAFQIGIHPISPAASDFIYWMLTEPAVQERISAAASGTTGLGNIAVTWLKDLRLPWPHGDEQATLVSTLDAVNSCGKQYTTCMEQLQHLRSALLSELLSGKHSIPETYDLLLSA